MEKGTVDSVLASLTSSAPTSFNWASSQQEAWLIGGSLALLGLHTGDRGAMEDWRTGGEGLRRERERRHFFVNLILRGHHWGKGSRGRGTIWFFFAHVDGEKQ